MQYLSRYLYLLTLLCGLFTSLSVWGQFVVDKRYEFSLERFGREDYELIKLENKGLLVLEYDQPAAFTGKVQTKTYRFDNQLNLLLQKMHLLPSSLFNQNRLIYYDRVSHLYIYGTGTYGRQFDIFRLDVFTGEGMLLSGELPFNMEVQRLSAIDDNAYFIGSARNKPVVLKYNFVEQIPKVLPSFFGENEVLGAISPVPERKKVFFALANTDRNDCRLSLQAYSTLLGLTKRTFIETQERYTPRDALVLPNPDEKHEGVVIGTYSNDCHGEMMQGLFTGKFNSGEPAKVSFYPFVDFNNFFEHYSERRAERMRKKVVRKRRKGKNLRLNERFALNPRLIETPQGEWLSISEKYYSQYQNTINPNPYNYGLPNRGMMLPQNRQTFRFTYAVICAFDENGRRKWDNVMSIDNIEKEDLESVVQLGFQGDSLITAYFIPEDEEIYSKKMHRYRNLKDEYAQELKDIFEAQGVANSYESEFIHLEDEYFLLFGEQRLKQPNPEQLGRRVFHLSVLKYVDFEEEKDEKELVKERKRKEKLERKE